MNERFLGVDIGTSGCKAEVFSQDGECVSSVKCAYPLETPRHGFVEQDAEGWWKAVCKCLLELSAKGDLINIAAVGVDGQSWAAVPIDKHGNVLAKTPIWMDSRAESICRQTEKRIGKQKIFAISGNPFSPGYTLPKLLYWMRECPELVSRTDKILQSNSFIVYRLTGSVTMDVSMAFGWQNFDFKNMRYDDELTMELGIHERFLIPPVSSDSVVGRVTHEAASQCGLKEGTPVVAGGLDAACAALGVGVINAGQTQEQGGQAGGMSICMDKPLACEGLILGAHVVPNKFLMQGGTVAGGASMEWFAREFGGDSANVFETFSKEAELVESGRVIFLPYLNGERSPIWDANAQGMFFGLDLGTTRGCMIRAIMEGVAFSLRHNLELAESSGAVVNELRATGGSALSEVWTQIKADITQKRMVVPDIINATTFGAAILAGVGVGCLSYERVTGLIREKRTHNPNSCSNYNELYKLYRELYKNNRDSMYKLAKLKESLL